MNNYSLSVSKHLSKVGLWLICFTDTNAMTSMALTVFQQDIGQCVLGCLERVKWPANIFIDSDMEQNMTKLSRTNKRSVKKSTPVVIDKTPSVGATTFAPKPNPVTVAEVDSEVGPINEMVDLTKLPYRDLQAMAAEMGLKANGSAANLVKRIQGVE